MYLNYQPNSQEYFLSFQYFYGISSDVDSEHAGKLIKVNAKTGHLFSFLYSVFITGAFQACSQAGRHECKAFGMHAGRQPNTLGNRQLDRERNTGIRTGI